MREEVLVNAWAHDFDTTGYDLTDLEGIEISWGNPQVELDAVFRPRIDTPFRPTTFNDLELGKGGSSKNLTVFEWKKKTRKTLLQQV